MAHETSGTNVPARTTEEIINLYADMVYRIAYTHVQIKADADDVFQEVFLLYCKKQPTFESEAHRRNWLINVTLKCCRKVTFGAFRQRTVPLEEDLPCAGALPDDAALSVYAAVRALPPRYRAAIWLFYYEDLPVKEIAEALGVPPDTVKSLLFRGRKKLKEQLKGAFFDE